MAVGSGAGSPGGAAVGTSSAMIIQIPEPLSSKRPAFQPRRSLFRSWKQLSRLQRNLLVLFLGATLVIAFYLYLGVVQANSQRVRPFRQRGREQTKEDFPQPLGGHHANKAERVHDFLQQHERDEQNVAMEVVDEDKRDDDESLDFPDERQGIPLHLPNEDVIDKENNAGEIFGQAPNDEPRRVGPLPPSDGSLVFSGPQNERQQAVVDAMKHAWNGYKAHAFGHDHLRPLSKSGQNWFGLGLTIVDAMDTLFVMNLKEEFREARDWVAGSMVLNVNKDVNFFETTIRVLGGLLSAFHLSADKVFLDKAKILGDSLLGAFSSPSGIPYSDVNLMSGRGHAPKWGVDSSTSEVSTVQLEFRDLSRATGIDTFEDKVDRVSRIIHDQPKTQGLVPIYINANSGKLRATSTITMGARADSYYEYLLKQWIQTGKTVSYLRDDFVEAVEGIKNKLARRTVPNNLLYIGEILSGGKTFKPKMDELACFLPGTLALGVHHGLPKSHLSLAHELAYTCYLTFARQPTFLAAEITYFNSEPDSTTDFYVKANDAHYLLRPETIESFWYLYYVTGNKTYQDWGWKIFQGIEKYTKVQHGYTSIGNVKNPLDLRPKDMMESFLLGETFKYLYLLFADRHEIDLDRWVINTEAHLLPVFPN